MNVILRGKVRRILEDMIAEGYANTKSEAIRLTILNFGERHAEGIMVNEKLNTIDAKVREGKRRLLSSDEALGVHAKYLK